MDTRQHEGNLAIEESKIVSSGPNSMSETKGRANTGKHNILVFARPGAPIKTSLSDYVTGSRQFVLTDGMAASYDDVADLPSTLALLHSEQKTAYQITKRFLDILASGALLLLTLPVSIAIAVAITTTSRGPVLFKQKRLGTNGREFWCYKFRSMVIDAEEQLQKSAVLQEEFKESFKLKNDPRVTTVGAFLRKTSLDELPQLFNVFSGEMSMIGPRPIVPKELEKYGMFDRKLLTVKPGLSGMWQACGRSDTSYVERVSLDMIYIDNASILLDIQLMIMTLVAVSKRRGAY